MLETMISVSDKYEVSSQNYTDFEVFSSFQGEILEMVPLLPPKILFGATKKRAN